MHRVNGDDGAIAVLVAVLMVGLLGFGALVIDVGQAYAERRQLQNGADAAALAVAQDCPSTAGCDARTVPGGMAGKHANANANDTATAVTEVCGTGPNLSACTPRSPAGWDCLPTPGGAAAGAPYVQVRTQTLSGGGTLLPTFLAQVIHPGYGGATVRACARAAYGAPQVATSSLALTLSYCEWDAATAGGTSYAPAPPYPPHPAASHEKRIFLHTTSGLSTCGGGPAGWDLPGGFGWLEDGNGDCSTEVDVDGTYGDKTGVGTPSACKDPLQDAFAAKDVLHIPVYDGVQGTGGNGAYHLEGFAAFVLTGYSLPGLPPRKSWLTGTSCGTGSDKCLSGFFTKELVPSSGVIGGPSMGVTVVQMTG